MARNVYGKIDPELLMPEEQRVFPDPGDLGRIPALIEQLGGVDIAFGGIGITGHLAFNEPQPELTPEQFAQLPTRVLDIHPETRATNCVGDLGGALEDIAAPGRVPGLAPGRVPPGGLRRGDRRLPRHPGPEAPRRPAVC